MRFRPVPGEEFGDGDWVLEEEALGASLLVGLAGILEDELVGPRDGSEAS